MGQFALRKLATVYAAMLVMFLHFCPLRCRKIVHGCIVFPGSPSLNSGHFFPWVCLGPFFGSCSLFFRIFGILQLMVCSCSRTNFFDMGGIIGMMLYSVLLTIGGIIFTALKTFFLRVSGTQSFLPCSKLLQISSASSPIFSKNFFTMGSVMFSVVGHKITSVTVILCEVCGNLHSQAFALQSLAAT